MTKRRSFDRDYILAEIEKLSTSITKPTKIFIIGGLSMMQHDLKDATKDIDVVVVGTKDPELLIEALVRMKYEILGADIITHQYVKMETSKIMQNKDGFRWDIFYGKICNKLTFSTNMSQRAIEFYSRGNIKLAIASKEDIFLFKGITEREADLNDMRLLVESGIDWQVVKEECRYQSDISGKLWEDALVQNLIDLRTKYKIKSPIEKELTKLCEEKMAEDRILKSIASGHSTFKEISEDTTLEYYYVREQIKRMTKKRLLIIDMRYRPYTVSLV
ncbi:MAG TPA: DUF6036 family nucleotidyltransferase [Candidatus Bathyarchaeia archaeon]|nr:DUF6036 family nucleotidyltransferase [Candidatus Bathyarchaeia archaeon]